MSCVDALLAVKPLVRISDSRLDCTLPAAVQPLFAMNKPVEAPVIVIAGVQGDIVFNMDMLAGDS